MPLSRAIIDAIWPEGSIWQPEDGADLDRLLDGIAENQEAVRRLLADLATLRDPMLTTILSDLEREFGITPDSSIDEDVRRSKLLAAKTDGSSDGSSSTLQSQLQAAGFNVQVHINDPVANPANFVTFSPNSIFGNPDAIFNGDGVQFGGRRGFLLVNGPIYYQQQKIEYDSPADPIYWPLVFFIGGTAFRDSSRVITSIETVTVPIARKAEFIRLVVKYKPLHSWAGVVVNFV